METSISKALDSLWTDQTYGPYRHKGTIKYRNYHRKLKNGKGLTFMQVWEISMASESIILKHIKPRLVIS